MKDHEKAERQGDLAEAEDRRRCAMSEEVCRILLGWAGGLPANVDPLVIFEGLLKAAAALAVGRGSSMSEIASLFRDFARALDDAAPGQAPPPERKAH